MTIIKLRGESFELRLPTTMKERRALQWIAEHYPVEHIRGEAALLLTGICCTAKPRGKLCGRPAKRRCHLCERAICQRHSIKVHSDLGGSYHVCLTCRWKGVPHLDRSH